MSAYIMRTAQRADLSMPWAVHLTGDGTVTDGRPDADRLLGFQRDLAVHQIDLAVRDVLGMGPDALEAVVGMFPVSVGALGGPGVNDGRGMFVTGDAIVSLEPVPTTRVEFEVTVTHRYETEVPTGALPKRIAGVVADLAGMPEGRRTLDDLGENQQIALLEYLLDTLAPTLESVDDATGDVTVRVLGDYRGGGVL
jgi:hypothetical protein